MVWTQIPPPAAAGPSRRPWPGRPFLFARRLYFITIEILELHARSEEPIEIYLARPNYNGRLQLGQPGICFCARRAGRPDFNNQHGNMYCS